MRALEPVDLSFFDDAPALVRNEALVTAPREQVFRAIAADPAGWGRWFPGFGDDGRWETPPPYGVGSVRSVRAFATRYRETILAWQDGERWAFRVDETTSPLFRAFAEDYRVSDAAAGTLLTWTVAFRPAPAMRPLSPLAPFAMGAVLRRAAGRLSRVCAES